MQDNGNITPGTTPPRMPLTKEQRYSLAFLLFLGIGVLGFWVYTVKKNLGAPFSPIQRNYSTNEQKVQTQDDLRAKDTDSDGLNDWDELNIYSTSPYLEDTDSDTFADKQEIDSGNDPNCPKGQDCSLEAVKADSRATEGSATDIVGDLQAQTTDAQALEALMTGKKNITPAELRELLLQSGMDPLSLQKISDSDLMASYQQMMDNSTSTKQ